MLRILVVDDEIGIIQLIKRLIDPAIPAEVIGEADDGNRAYELMKRIKPDIVITDIRMPGLSGVELVQKAREEGLPCEFILVSGYRDFNYARSAIRYGVLDYLLKPINREDLNQLIMGVYEKQKNSNQIRERLAIAEEQLARNQSFLRKELLMRCIDYIEKGRPLENIEKYSGGFLPSEGIYNAVIIKLDTELEEAEEFFIQRNAELISKQYIRSIGSLCQELEEFCAGSRNYVLIRTDSREDMDRIRELLEKNFLEKTPRFYPFIVTAAMGKAAEDLTHLKDCFVTADRTLWQRLRKGCGRFLYYERDVKENGEEQGTIGEEACEKIRKEILTLSGQRAEGMLERYLEEVSRRDQPVYQLKNQVCGLLELVDSITGSSEEGEDLEEERTQEVRTLEKSLDGCMDQEQIIAFCLHHCRQMIENCIGRKTEKNSRAVRKVQAYLKEHIRDEINLEKIAAQVGLTGAYISTIFKKETGMTPTNYLIQLRIEKAKELIRTTDLTINEVAYAVGYVDARYFSKLFIKIVGIKPVEYRRFYAK